MFTRMAAILTALWLTTAPTAHASCFFSRAGCPIHRRWTATLIDSYGVTSVVRILFTRSGSGGFDGRFRCIGASCPFRRGPASWEDHVDRLTLRPRGSGLGLRCGLVGENPQPDPPIYWGNCCWSENCFTVSVYQKHSRVPPPPPN